MRFILFKIFLKIAAYLSPDKGVSHNLKQRLICYERQREMDACQRPKTYPTVKKGHCTYTDFWER